jgi:hypothetical protein
MLASLVVCASAVASVTTARAETSPVAGPPVQTAPEGPRDEERKLLEDVPRLVLDDGRFAFPKPERGVIKVGVHGELQLRYVNQSRLRLTPPVSDDSQRFLGQRNYGLGWLRTTVQATFGEPLRAVVQVDFLPRWVIGDLARGVSAAGDHALDERVPAYARLRYAYLDWTTPIGLLRVGQTGNNWGLGILANNGDRPLIFGDYRFGSLVERVAFATKPFGKDKPFVVAIAGDAVFQDATAKWTEGDRAYQAVFSAGYDDGVNQLGFFGVRRWHRVRNEGPGTVPGDIDAWIADVAGRGVRSISSDVVAFGAFEVATIQGTTDAIRSTPEFNEQKIRSWGGAVQVGLVKRAKGPTLLGPPQGSRDEVAHGQIVALVESGYASGDANPYDGTIKRFTFDPNHQVGLVLFPYVLHNTLARAATNAADGDLVARPLPGSRFLVSNGGVFGASYVNPVVVVRPWPDLDLKAGAVVAVASSEVVDPYRTTVSPDGGAQSYRGGSPKSRDLGFELDAGFEWRLRLQSSLTLQLGAQAGFFFPGRAFDDARGNRAATQSVVQGRVGVQF